MQGQTNTSHLNQDTLNRRITNKGVVEMTPKEFMKKTVQLINTTAGASKNVNFLTQLSLDALMLAIMSERAEILEEVLREQVQEVRKKNNKLKDANVILGKARASKTGASETDKTEMPKEIKQFFADNDIPWSGKGNKVDPNQTYTLNSNEWDLAIENVKGFTEGLTSSSQLDMTKLQSTSGKFNQTFEMMSQFLAKWFRTGDAVIKNF